MFKLFTSCHLMNNISSFPNDAFNTYTIHTRAQNITTRYKIESPLTSHTQKVISPIQCPLWNRRTFNDKIYYTEIVLSK